MSDESTIKLKKSTIGRIRKYGKMGDTFDSALNKIMDRIDQSESKKTDS